MTNTNLYATNDRPRGTRVDWRHMGGEQYRREMRAALHDLQQGVGQSHNGLSVVQPIVKASPAESTVCRMRRKLFRRVRGIYTIFTSCGLL
jgi:hypothetical protein